MKRQQKGQMVFVSSVAGLRKFANGSIYGASKWAVQGIAGSLREECRGTGVKVATLCPGGVATPWWLERERGGKAVPATEEQMAKMLTAEDVASAAMSIVDQVRYTMPRLVERMWRHSGRHLSNSHDLGRGPGRTSRHLFSIPRSLSSEGGAVTGVRKAQQDLHVRRKGA